MSQASRHGRWHLLSLSLGLAFIVSCGQENLMGPGDPGAPSNTITASAADPLLAAGAPNLLTWAGSGNALAKGSPHGQSGKAEKRIKWEKGGKVGGDATFGVTVYIPPKALREDQKITVYVHPSNTMLAEFGPSYQFSGPVQISFDLSYAKKGRKKPGRDTAPSSLSVWSYDESTGVWTQLSSSEHKGIISAWVDHFSIYGVGD